MADRTVVFGYSPPLAESTVPTAVSDGDEVMPWFDLYGRLILFGANISEEGLNIIDTAPALMETLERIDTPLLDAVTATGASDWIDVSMYKNQTFYIVATSVTSGGTMKIQATPDESNVVDIDTQVIGSNTVIEVSFSGIQRKKIRANLTARTDGTYSVFGIFGN